MQMLITMNNSDSNSSKPDFQETQTPVEKNPNTSNPNVHLSQMALKEICGFKS